MFTLKRPCANCPFQRTPRFHLTYDFAEEIVEALRQGGNFACHNTVDYGDVDDGYVGPDAKMCAGAMMVLHNEDTIFVNQMARMRCQFPDGSGINPETFPESWYDFAGAEVYDNLEEFISEVSA